MKALFTLEPLILLFFSLFYFFSYPEVDPDLWGHLYFGREILQGRGLPAQNIYSYTAPDQPWINHEWLAEVVFYLVFRFFGSPGLILFKVALGSGIIWILDRCIRKRVPSLVVRALTLVWILAILSPGFNIRPQLFTYLFFAIFLFLFYRFEAGSKTALYWAPLLMLLWVNLHGGLVAGLGALALFSLIAGLDKQHGARTAIFLPLALSLLVLFVNPYGWDLLRFLARDVILDRPITEWNPVPLWDFSFLEFKLAGLFIAIFAFKMNYWRRWDFMLLCFSALFAFRHQRHVPLFALTAAPFLAAGMLGLLRRMERGLGRAAIMAGLSLAALYLFFQIGRMHLDHRFQLLVDPKEYPTQAADFLKRNGVRGNLAVPFDWGEYLIWKLYPEVRVSIDGRYTTAYPMEVIEDHWEWMAGKTGWRTLLERYPTEIAITNRYHPVTALLRKDPEWVYIYSDPIAFIFVRKTSSQEGFLEKSTRRHLPPPQAPSIYFPG